ncbi:MAG: hypothetical protein M3P41_13660 [Actinomycetota bacterium]|nr:hypothetical protein [Actinomycetota bacterium]
MLVLVMVVGVSSVIGAFLVGRRSVAFVAPAVWALFMLGLTQDWWGHGVGDGWQYALVVGAAVVAAGAATGVIVRRAMPRRTDGTLRPKNSG